MVRRLAVRARCSDQAHACARRPDRAQPGDSPGLLPAPLGSFRRRPGGAPDLCLHPQARGRGSEQQLDGPCRGQPEGRRAVRRQHARPDHVRRAVLHGTARLPLRAVRRGDHRQRIRRAQHAHHDAHGRVGAGPHRARRCIRAWAALDGRSRSRTTADHAFPRGSLDQERWVRLRRQRPAWQEMPCAAHRKLAGARRGLACGTHADRRRRESRGRDPLSRMRVPLGVRQDQPGHARAAAHPAGLEGLDHRRRHRVAVDRRARDGCGRSTRSRASLASCPGRTRRPTATPTR